MVKTLLLVSQAYLGFATTETLASIAARVRVAVVLERDEVLNPRLAPFVAEVHRLTGHSRQNLQPAFDPEELAAVVRGEIAAAGGDPAAVVLFCQHEDNVLSTAQARRLTGVAGDGPELVSRFRDKIVMKQALAAHLPEALPRYLPLDVERADRDPAGYYGELTERLGRTRLIVKPTAGAGSLGVATVAGPEDLREAAGRILSSDREFTYEVDEFLEGTMYQCDSFVRHGKVRFCGILELGCSNFDFVNGRPLSVFSVAEEDDYRQLFEFNQAVVSALGFTDGSTHHEIFVQRAADGRLSVKFVEIAARVPGGLGVPFHERNSGINLVDTNLLLALGDPAADAVAYDTRHDVVSALLPVGHGRITALHEPELASDYSIDWRVGVGDVVDSRSLIDNAGILTLVNGDRAALRRDFESLQSYVPVSTERELVRG